MQNDRYAGQGGFNPAVLGAAVAVNAAMLAGLIFSSPVVDMIRHPHETIVSLIPIAEPPPPEPQPRPEPPRSTPHDLYVPKPEVPNPVPTADPMTSTDLFPPPPALPGPAEAGVAADPPVPPPPLPALVGAEPDPRYAGDFQPDYPASELRAERDGRVTVRVLIGVDGRVQDVQRVSATSDAFFDATRKRALARWRFRPATRGGVPEPVWRTMSVNFVLEDAR